MGTIQWSITNDKGDTIYHATGETAAYYFKRRGAYNVCLTADNGHLATKIRTVMVDTMIKADFAYRYCQNVFDNQSACSDQYVWVLPDGSTTTDPFPAFKFDAPGTYPIKLTAIKGNKQHTLSTTIKINGDSLGFPSAVFTYKKIAEPATFEFKAVDSLLNYYSWYFGDTVSDDTSGYKVTHAIDLEKYKPTVGLFVSNICGFAAYEADPLSTTEIKKNDLSNSGFSVYPNPVTNELNVVMEDAGNAKTVIAKLYDINGKVIKAERAITVNRTCQLTVDLSTIARGIYFLQLVLDEKLFSKRIVVQ
jgi:PKD repeat protein